MGHTAENLSVCAPTSEPREKVPAEVYEGIDFAAFNEELAAYRALTRERGFSAALSRYAGETRRRSQTVQLLRP